MTGDRHEKARGPRGGVKHTPGRGHNLKSGRQKKRVFARKAARERQREEEGARKVWAEYDDLPDEVKKLLGPKAIPKKPRPSDAN